MLSITESKENYLKTIYTLDPCREGARVTDIADALNVTKASASRAVSELEKEGYVDRSNKRQVVLSESGFQKACEIKNRYEIILSFLVEVLHVNGKASAQEACKLEHVISDATLNAMRYFLGEAV